MKNNNEIEKLLLNDSEYDKLVKSKTEQSFIKEVLEKSNTGGKIVTDIKQVPKNKLFSKDTVFEVLNKSSRTKSYINGLQAEGFLGVNSFDRTKLLEGESNSFVRDDVYVKFIKCNL